MDYTFKDWIRECEERSIFYKEVLKAMDISEIVSTFKLRIYNLPPLFKN